VKKKLALVGQSHDSSVLEADCIEIDKKLSSSEQQSWYRVSLDSGTKELGAKIASSSRRAMSRSSLPAGPAARAVGRAARTRVSL
jgi:hypothetical protein